MPYPSIVAPLMDKSNRPHQSVIQRAKTGHSSVVAADLGRRFPVGALAGFDPATGSETGSESSRPTLHLMLGRRKARD